MQKNPTTKTCTKCNGKGYVTCVICGGDGLYTCPTCGGS
ncbi:MAG: hypothetical protein FJ150_09130, partial [Euryarchaeota archaeon]|nr:hypothetical protein [Euryarchaeota archaeon]